MTTSEHNHITRDIKPPGQCPGCDRQYELHDCGYVEGSFACKIRHIHLDTSWAKGDH